MTASSILEVATPELRVNVVLEGAVLYASFVGNADGRSVETIDALLKKLHAEALKRSTREIAVDLKGLEFMNSSCFKVFLTWISGLEDLDKAKQYSIVFRSDPEKHWQRRSLDALRSFAGELIRIEP